VETLHIPAKDIIFFGESIGCAVAAYLAQNINQENDSSYWFRIS